MVSIRITHCTNGTRVFIPNSDATFSCMWLVDTSEHFYYPNRGGFMLGEK